MFTSFHFFLILSSNIYAAYDTVTVLPQFIVIALFPSFLLLLLFFIILSAVHVVSKANESRKKCDFQAFIESTYIEHICVIMFKMNEKEEEAEE